MYDDIASSLALVLQMHNLAAILAGVAFGAFMGAVPGLTGTMGIALIIPMTYALEPITAFCILLGVYKSCLFSGSIPAILINTPGSPAAAATVLDGYPLTKKGRAGEAMGMALWASTIADTISTLILIVGAVLLAQIATRFGPPEYAALVLFALTIVAGVSGPSLIKGMIAASLGLLLATIGLDPIDATPRFTFGSLELMGGVSLMAMLIGLFAVSELLEQAMAPVRQGVGALVIDKARVALDEIRRSAKTILRGTAIGVVLGSIPGLGATPAAFLSYSEAKRNAADPEAFGKGTLEGVAATESANNATCGGSLIPLLALGVPGDVTTAILLGAFLIHGLAPGPTLFTDEISLVYAIFVALLIAGLMMPLVGLAAIRLFSTIAKVPRAALYPVIALLCSLGVYGFNSSILDIWVMLAFGVLGFAMRKLEFPLAPLMIGFVLEPLGEQSIRQALVLSSGDWSIFVSTPISVLFVALTVLSAIFVIRRARRDGP